MLEQCPHCGAKAAVRKDTGGRLYYVCECGGPFNANEYLLEHAVIWGEGGTPPDNCPDWIRRGLAYKPGTRNGNGDRPRAPAPEPNLEAGPGDAAEPSTGTVPSGDACALCGSVEACEHSLPGVEPAPGLAHRDEPEPEPRFRFGLFR
jgi:hypothetical protein